MIMGSRMWVVCLSALLCACATTAQRAPVVAVEAPPGPPVHAELFGAPVSIPGADQLFSLSPQQQAHFLEYFNDPAQSGYKPHERIHGYLEGRLGDFRYHGSTLTATEALASNNGNCLSLAMVTTALARLAGVEVDYQLVRNALVYERRDGLVTVADHVRTRLYDPTFEPVAGTGRILRPHIVIDYFPEPGQRRGGRVDTPEVLAMFYVNLAGEALLAHDLQRSYWLLQAALDSVSDSPAALNSMAVLHRIAGDAGSAEALFHYALDLHADNVNLLGNLRNLVRGQGRTLEAEALEQKLLELPNRDPYRLIEFGIQAQGEGRLHRALAFYDRASVLAPYLHEAYWRKAVVYQALGEPARAEELLQQALHTAPRADDRHLYHAKLGTLGSSQQH